ncbi:C4-dicarboxylate ABC transporter permease [Kiloniella spongiae]|uniref:TRAP transporter large permease protein n=1 Tax=Kiloniella spongiae TaxID=1489064 RepID=A0A0H2MQI2_9PROT|nr:TRAP transporter large permease [Kiloniella spongiae]KLN58920.1 C4-dicarboxylate ABC transporter permease [Kiloniella spongiae]
MAILVLFTLLFLLLLVGTPIAFSLGLASLTTIIFFSNDSLGSISLKFFETMEHYTLLAIPFFILSSAFLSTGGVARRLIRFAMDCVGHLQGGMAMASVLACMLFAAVSGSSPATVVAIGSIVIAGMQKAGYSKEFAAGVICNAGTLGILIPPSIVMVVYAAATDVSVGRMFMAGVIPGLIAGLMLMIGIYVAARVKKLPRLPKASGAEVFAAFGDAIWGLMLIVIIMGGIYGGIFTPTEAAAVASVYAFVIAVFVYRDMGPLKGRDASDLGVGDYLVAIPKSVFDADVRKTILEASKVTIMLLFIVANAMLFAHVLTTERIPQTITSAILEAGLEPWMFLIVVNILLLVAGNFMEPSAILLIMAPILFPIAMQLGIDPIHLGIIMVVNMEIGMITPPVGLNLFVTAGITGMPILKVVKAALPWLMILLVFLILITYVPIISTFLPDLVYGVQK